MIITYEGETRLGFIALHIKLDNILKALQNLIQRHLEALNPDLAL